MLASRDARPASPVESRGSQVKRRRGYSGWIFAVSAGALVSCNSRSHSPESATLALTPAAVPAAAAGVAASVNSRAPVTAAVARALAASVQQGDAPGIVGLVVD